MRAKVSLVLDLPKVSEADSHTVVIDSGRRPDRNQRRMAPARFVPVRKSGSSQLWRGASQSGRFDVANARS
jgi:hypothetical protein